jgi:hypothetical protein
MRRMIRLEAKISASVGGFDVNGNRSSFRNVVFSSYLQLQKVEKVYKPSDSQFIIEVR